MNVDGSWHVRGRELIVSCVLQPPEFLVQPPGEDVRMSVVVPVNDECAMPFAARYRLERKPRFRLSIAASFSRHEYQSGQ